ncbi:TauD-domain-containing protein [Clavulina sp. PMI_390]|nr:TauD-domain-containing protein [Clavulina sp. PMI_390]
MPSIATEVLTPAPELEKLSIKPSGPTPTANPVPPPPTNGQTLGGTENYKYAHLLPVFDPSEKYPPLELFEHVDPGHRALNHENPNSFLTSREAKTIELTPSVGTEVHGVDLLSLNNDERDELALFVAQKGVVVFRDQENWLDASIDQWKDFGSYFGRLHIHPTSGHPEGHPELHLVYRAKDHVYNYERNDYLATSTWHSDVSYEKQPPGLTTFWLVDQPSTGGDTMFISQVASLKRFSPAFVAFLRTLTAVHSAVAQADYSRSGRRGGVVRREPVENVHPVIRKHPVTGEEALYVNYQFTTRIVELKREESDNLLKFLYDETAKALDAHLRVKWQPNTVVIWDNRVTAHSAIVDYVKGGERRHGVRLAPQAEQPTAA